MEQLVDRIVAAARIPGRRRRLDVRAELVSHFEAALEAGEPLPRAVQRLGGETALAIALRRAHRRDYALLCCAKIAGSALASVAAALAIQLLVNLRLGAGMPSISPMFLQSSLVAVAVALGLVVAWESGRRTVGRLSPAPVLFAYAAVCFGADQLLDLGGATFAWSAALIAVGLACSRVAGSAARAALTVAAFAGTILVLHGSLSVSVGLVNALITGAGLAAVWLATTAILSRSDHLFLDRLGLTSGSST